MTVGELRDKLELFDDKMEVVIDGLGKDVMICEVDEGTLVKNALSPAEVKVPCCAIQCLFDE